MWRTFLALDRKSLDNCFQHSTGAYIHRVHPVVLSRVGLGALQHVTNGEALEILRCHMFVSNEKTHVDRKPTGTAGTFRMGIWVRAICSDTWICGRRKNAYFGLEALLLLDVAGALKALAEVNLKHWIIVCVPYCSRELELRHVPPKKWRCAQRWQGVHVLCFFYATSSV